MMWSVKPSRNNPYKCCSREFLERGKDGGSSTMILKSNGICEGKNTILQSLMNMAELAWILAFQIHQLKFTHCDKVKFIAKMWEWYALENLFI